MSRVATSSLQNQILNHVVNNTADYARLQEQITTGKKAQQYSGLGDLAGQQIDLSAQVRAYDQYTENSQTASSRSIMPVASGSPTQLGSWSTSSV